MPTEQSSRFTATQSELFDAAFGSNPGRFPLPAAADPRESWFRSVALAGQGRYSAAEVELRRHRPSTPELRSLHASTRASWLRQVGEHERARRFDGIAVSLVGLVGPSNSKDSVEARSDALTGLAADALGSGRFHLADAMLARSAEQRQGPVGQGLWRPALRAAWVAAELAMMRGDGAEAVRHAEAARALSTDADSLRHSIKTDLVLAAALSCVGETSRARASAVQVASAAAMHGLLPLRWAATMLCEGTGGIDPGMATSADLAAVIDRRGRSSVD
ncbi:hypothetical protein CH251_02995 [Rhodococcus sp. 06-462-5]|uniref:hypothetical protein n=1 Tax=unclassified Rhodococcus (in: high G+C Gram-positive bacteria) TaxID=192944 RepID=UPI000B9BAD22|nr:MULTISPECIES: hypothetical protein [unclassified Rhodococcus (in: high G+C Gram-positive bacteria)]OZC78723.1 hypothetical protein CH251_02995 [Rhodococcus sp. 06-462-5]OZE62003.1 hypothetical protein CH270_20180 [Rhodococcus sp. 02-925g]